MRSGCQHSRCVEVRITSDPGEGKVATIGKQTEISDEPSPRPANHGREKERKDYAEHRSAPERDEWIRIRLVQTQRQSPRRKIKFDQGRPAEPTANEMPDFVSRCHYDPRSNYQADERAYSSNQSIKPESRQRLPEKGADTFRRGRRRNRVGSKKQQACVPMRSSSICSFHHRPQSD